jgi:L-fuconolactonase
MNAIDTHVHFWKYDKKRYAWINKEMKVLQEDHLPEHLALTLKRNSVDAVVAVQADQSELETRFLVELANTHDVIKGVVGWIDLQSENVVEHLQNFSQFPVIKGWRHIAQDEPSDFLLRKDFQRGIAALSSFNYTYDILVYHHQLTAAAEFVASFPNQAFVIDHCAKPDIKNKKIDEWKKDIKAIAKYPNVCCKLSGLFTETKWKDWSPAEFYPYLDTVFEAFGVNRLMFGSDWPVMLLSGMYVQWKSLLEKYMENHSEDDREKVFQLNGQLFYNL